MCLRIRKNARRKIAWRKIKVYKFLVNTGHKLETPYYNVRIRIGETYKSKLKRYKCIIEEGLHSLTTLEGVTNISRMHSESYCVEGYNKVVLVECEIPRFSIYYEGTFSSYNEESIASNRLKYVRIIE